MFVLDASAIIASINRETGADQIDAVLFESVIGAVALAEAHTKVSEWDGRGEQALNLLVFSAHHVAPFTQEQAILCGQLRQATRSAGLSLGDRACIALAALMDVEVITADREWAKLQP